MVLEVPGRRADEGSKIRKKAPRDLNSGVEWVEKCPRVGVVEGVAITVEGNAEHQND